MKITIETQDKKALARINELLPMFMEFVIDRAKFSQSFPKHPPPGPLFEIDERYLSSHTINALKQEGIYTIPKLITYSEAELLTKPKFGRKAILEVKGLLKAHGATLKDDTTN